MCHELNDLKQKSGIWKRALMLRRTSIYIILILRENHIKKDYIDRLDDTLMNDIQDGLLEMLTDIDAALRKNGVQYSLDSGTAIGGVRHHGFIPWDDDADLIVKECDLERFENAIKNLPEEKYYLQRPFSTDWSNSFYKIRLNSSTAIEESHLGTRMHQGLFVDVFVARNYPKGKFRQKIYELLLLCQRGLRRISFHNYGKPRRDGIQSLLYSMQRRVIKTMAFICEKDSPYYHLDYGNPYPPILKKDFEECIDCDFEGTKLRLFKGYDRILTTLYGDYMTPPPEDKRVGGHLIAYERNIDYKVWLKEHGYSTENCKS